MLTTDIHALGTIRTHGPSKRAAAESHTLGREATGIGCFLYKNYIIVATGRSSVVTLSVFKLCSNGT